LDCGRTGSSRASRRGSSFARIADTRSTFTRWSWISWGTGGNRSARTRGPNIRRVDSGLSDRSRAGRFAVSRRSSSCATTSATRPASTTSTTSGSSPGTITWRCRRACSTDPRPLGRRASAGVAGGASQVTRLTGSGRARLRVQCRAKGPMKLCQRS
jgi:hypothetical protein